MATEHFRAPPASPSAPIRLPWPWRHLIGDGKADLVIANDQTGTVSVLLGNGDGTFQGPTTFSAGTAPVSVAVADVTGDGYSDLIVANDTNPGSVSVLLGNGNGTFQSPTSFAAAAQPLSVAAMDVNGDGKPDLVVAYANSASVSVLLGNGNATFQSPISFATGPDPASVAVADVNGDGRPDLVAANAASNTVSVLLNAGNGNFTGQVYTIDTVGPFVQSINRTTPHGPVITTAGSVTFTVTFSEPVTGVVPSDFQVALTGVGHAP